jgi:hypothetical protein
MKKQDKVQTLNSKKRIEKKKLTYNKWFLNLSVSIVPRWSAGGVNRTTSLEVNAVIFVSRYARRAFSFATYGWGSCKANAYFIAATATTATVT